MCFVSVYHSGPADVNADLRLLKRTTRTGRASRRCCWSCIRATHWSDLEILIAGSLAPRVMRRPTLPDRSSPGPAESAMGVECADIRIAGGVRERAAQMSHCIGRANWESRSQTASFRKPGSQTYSRPGRTPGGSVVSILSRNYYVILVRTMSSAERTMSERGGRRPGWDAAHRRQPQEHG